MRPIASIEDARRIAKRRLPRLAYDYIAGGAEDEVTLRANRRAFEQVTLRPSYLVDVSARDQSTTIFGHRIASPVIIAPTGLSRLAGRDGDVAGARAAGRRDTIFTHSCMSSHSLEEVARAGAGPLWFQIFLWQDRDLIEGQIRRAKDAGYHALVFTVDSPVVGKRQRDLRNGFTLPPRPTLRTALDMLRRPRWLAQSRTPIAFRNFDASGSTSPAKTIARATYINQVLWNPGATYADLAWLREAWTEPLLVKGVLTAEDAERAVACGVDGVIVSNHGGRQLDGAPATLDALPEIARAVGGRADVFLDGGIRRGGDVVKALALGAKACMIGRPWLYGLASGDEDGVVHILEILHEEIDRTLALIGRRALDDLDPSVVGRAAAGQIGRPPLVAAP